MERRQNLFFWGLPDGAEDSEARAMGKFIEQVWNEEDGATAVEYGLMVALIAVVILSAVKLLGENLSAKFDTVATEIGNAGGS